MFRSLIILLVGAALFASCGGGGIRSGTITKKEYTPAHSENYLQAIPHLHCEMEGKYESCTTSYTYYPASRFVADHWDFKLESCTEGDAVNAKKCKHGEVAVDETTYHKYKEGDNYP